jgi:hypothetical protein
LAFRGAHQITGAAPAQPREVVFRVDAAVEDPDAAGLAVFGLDALHDVLEGGHVDGVAGEGFIGQRKALGGDHQRDDKLLAVGAVVTRVAAFGFRHLAALAAELAVPEGVQPELPPQQGGRPTVAEAARLAHAQGGKADLDDILRRRRGALAVGEEPALEQLAVVLVDEVQRVLPTAFLTRVEFAQVQDLALDGAPAVHPQAFAHRIVDMLLAVLAPDASLQKHAPSNHAARETVNGAGRPTRG